MLCSVVSRCWRLLSWTIGSPSFHPLVIKEIFWWNISQTLHLYVFLVIQFLCWNMFFLFVLFPVGFFTVTGTYVLLLYCAWLAHYLIFVWMIIKKVWDVCFMKYLFLSLKHDIDHKSWNTCAASNITSWNYAWKIMKWISILMWL